MQIIYKNEHDKQEFDKERYLNSLRSYGEIDEDLAQEVIKTKIEAFPIRHVSVLVREAIPLFKNEEDAKSYYEEHRQTINGEIFHRLIRTTGYLTGDYHRSNDSKIAEYADRTISRTGETERKLAYSAISEEYYSQKAKALREQEKQAHIQDNQNEYHKITVS